MTTVNLPVTRVVVMEDRAQVERRGEVPLSGDVTRVEVEGVSLYAVDRSLKLEVTGATLVDARLVRTWRVKPKGGLAADATELQKKARSLEDEVAAKVDDVARLEARRDVLAQARADVLRSIAETAGAGTGKLEAWKAQLAEISAAQRDHAETSRVARQALETSRTREAEAKRALAIAEEKEQDLVCSLALTLSGSGAAQVRASYLVPCAVWRPAYRASLLGTNVLVEAEGVVWQRTGEAWKDVELAFSTARPTLGTAPPMLVADVIATRPKATEEKRVVDVTMREEVIQTAGETSADEADLPGLDDGGEARILEATGKFSVPSDGQAHRVPLSKFEAPAELSRVCPAELTPLVSLVARFPNTSGQVLLAGPVDLIRTGGFVGRSSLSFAAPGETVKLSFGSEDGLRVVRSVETKSEEARLTGRRTSRHVISLFVSNASTEAAKIQVEERLPVSEVKEVEVQVLTRECSPAPASVSKEGVAKFEVSLPPNGTTKATFAWELSRSSNVTGV
jgi:uncharacterized protein (TIGR02231 family)